MAIGVVASAQGPATSSGSALGPDPTVITGSQTEATVSTTTVRWIASGFLYGRVVEQPTPPQTGTSPIVDPQATASPASKSYKIFLVTNRHVLKAIDKVVLRFNPEKPGNAQEVPLDLRNPKGQPIWFGHPNENFDVAVVPLNAQYLKNAGIQVAFFANDLHAADRAKANEIGLTEGDGVYVLGFPMGNVGRDRNFVIVRQGVIARIRDCLAGSSDEFLLDAFVFPGNSGGPVVSTPEITAIEGTKSQNSAYLIGMVKHYVPYADVAVSAQTGRPRVIFEENAGLAAVVPMDFIDQAIDASMRPATTLPVASPTQAR